MPLLRIKRKKENKGHKDELIHVFLFAAHLRTSGKVSCKHTHSSRLSHDELHRFLVMVLPEVEKRRSGVADVSGIASTRRTRRESHGNIWTPRRHSFRGLLVFESGSVVVGVRVLCTLDFINYLRTQLFHNHPSLVMFGRRNTRQTGNVAGIKAAGGNLLLQKE